VKYDRIGMLANRSGSFGSFLGSVRGSSWIVLFLGQFVGSNYVKESSTDRVYRIRSKLRGWRASHLGMEEEFTESGQAGLCGKMGALA